jgi:DNA-binding response OmpR family regulator
MQAIIISEDEDDRDVLIYVLRKAGLAVASSSSLERVLKNWTDHPADLLILSTEGNAQLLDSIEAIRLIAQIPVIFIVEEISEKLYCGLLENGTDVVLRRPVSPRVISAHVKAIIRRSSAIPSFVIPTLDLKEISLDPSTRTVVVFERDPVRLTQLEFRLLYTLMINRGQVIPLDVIVERVWGYTGKGNQDLVRGLISRLRRKLEADPGGQHFLETVSGVGYRFVIDEI